MDDPTLKPCPFCGGEAEFAEGETGDGHPWHYLECSECEALGPRVEYAAHNISVKECLLDAWNTRVQPDAAEVRAQALRDAADRLRIMGDMGGMQVVMDMIDQPALTPTEPRSEELPCQDCGGITFLWFAPHKLWNHVIGGPDARDDPGAMLCPNCFIRRAEAAGFNSSVWMVSPQTPAPVGGKVARDATAALRAISTTKGGE